MPTNSVAENVFGTLGTICWSGQILPQIWKSYREKSTEGLSHWLMFIWSISAAFLGVFAITQNLNVPLIVQPQLFGFLGLVSWSQCLYYGHKKSLVFSLGLLTTMTLILGGFESGMVFAIRPAVRGGNERPVQFFGIMASIIISAGLLPQFYEIYRFGEVKGISIPFMLIDFLGGVFSDLSLAFKPKFDVFGAITFSLVIILDGVVLILALILNPRAERRRRRLVEAMNMSEEGQGLQVPLPSAPVSIPESESPKSESAFHIDEKCDRDDINGIDRDLHSPDNVPQH